VPVHARVQHRVEDVPFLYSGEHFLTFGATFFSGAPFFFWGDFFFAGATYLCWRDFFSLALNCRPLLEIYCGLKVRTRVEKDG